jgi:hypothetical protein
MNIMYNYKGHFPKTVEEVRSIKFKFKWSSSMKPQEILDVISVDGKGEELIEEVVDERIENDLNFWVKIPPLRKGRKLEDVPQGTYNRIYNEMREQVAKIAEEKKFRLENGFNETENIGFMKEKEIMEYCLFFEVKDNKTGKWNGRFNRSEIFKLAHMFRKREGLDMETAMSHAWFWAREQKAVYINEGKYAPIVTSRMISRRDHSACMRRKECMPEDYPYTLKRDDWKKRWDEWRSLYADNNPKQAPFSVAKTWLLNVGVRFTNPKYGVCEILRHKQVKKTGEWQVEYWDLETEKKRTLPLVKCRGYLGLDWKLAHFNPAFKRLTAEPVFISHCDKEPDMGRGRAAALPKPVEATYEPDEYDGITMP